MSVVRLRGVRVRFPGRARPGLDGVDLDVEAGERVLLTGPSGCGKSTLLAVLTGVVPQAVAARVGGDVAVLGRDPRSTPVPTHALDVGWLGQDPASGTCLPTVDAEVALPLENRGVPAGEIRARVRRALEDVGAAHLAGRRTARLSGGEQQRVALAAVLAGDPRLLLLDEPTSMLDPVGAARVHAALARQGGRTTLLAAHRRSSGAWLPTREVGFDGSGRVRSGGAVRDTVPPAPVRTERDRGRPGPAVVRLRGAGWHQGGRLVVRDVDLDLRAGQVTAVVGCNGSGKSSLLLGLAGFLPGVGDVVGTGAAPPALVLQRPEHQLLTRTVAAEVAYGLRDRRAGRAGWLAGRASAERAVADEARDGVVREALATFGLDGLAGADPFRLSGGQQRRLTIAAMAVLDRPVLLLDEPTCGLDDLQAAHVVALVDARAARGTAVVLATHDLALARRVADQVVVLRDGDVVAAGPADLLDDDALLAGAGLLVHAGAGA
ncbi:MULTISPECIES: ABC transporter ATP-binding protein [unclassified Actinotalea]|uniref:ABC transporter ATP-binding protein n=1 Tax=unclassified Actinotalea TaxID=2638618 RepID=UPI0015F3F0FA|nr:MULTISPECIES: ABC transporter ATP-binding protein [unclassified Actinotalea]